MATTKRGGSDIEDRARRSQERASKHESGFFEFRCDRCSLVFAESELRIQHGVRVCSVCYEPGGDTIDRDNHRAWVSQYAANRTANRKIPKYPFGMETAAYITAFMPNPVVLVSPFFDEPGTSAILIIEGGDLGDVDFQFPDGVTVLSKVVSADGAFATFELSATQAAVAGDFPIIADGEYYRNKVRVIEEEVDLDTIYLRLDGTNNGPPNLTWLDTLAADAAYVPLTRQILTGSGLSQTGTTLAADMIISLDQFDATNPGGVPASGGDATRYLRGDGQWGVLPLFTDTTSGVVPASGGGTADYLRADGTWATPSGGSGSWDGGTITNPIHGPLGTKSSPTYATSGVAGTGIYFEGTGRILFASGGITKQRIGSATTMLASDATLSFSDNVDTELGLPDLWLKRSTAGALTLYGAAASYFTVNGDGATGAEFVRMGVDTGVPYLAASTAIRFYKAYYANKSYAAIVAGTNDINFATTNCHDRAVNATTTTFTFSGGVAGGRYLLCLKPTGGALTVTWPASVKWAGGTAPAAFTNGKTHLVAFFYDGASYFGTTALDF
jgi:hypothetical protein